MAVNRQRQFPELVATRTPEAARDDLVVYSRSEVDSAIGSIDLSDIETDISNLQGDVTDLQTDIDGVGIQVVDISGDLGDLDLSLTQLIVEERGEIESATTPANFSATHLIHLQDKNGLDVYIPCMSGGW